MIHGNRESTANKKKSVYKASHIVVIFRTFSIPSIFRNLVYSKVQWYLDQTYCIVFGRYFLAIIIFPGCSFLDYFNTWQNFKCTYVSIRATHLVHLFQAYLDISKYYSSAYSPTFRTLFIPDIFRVLVYSYYKAYSESIVYS